MMNEPPNLCLGEEGEARLITGYCPNCCSGQQHHCRAVGGGPHIRSLGPVDFPKFL